MKFYDICPIWLISIYPINMNEYIKDNYVIACENNFEANLSVKYASVFIKKFAIKLKNDPDIKRIEKLLKTNDYATITYIMVISPRIEWMNLRYHVKETVKSVVSYIEDNLYYKYGSIMTIPWIKRLWNDQYEFSLPYIQ